MSSASGVEDSDFDVSLVKGNASDDIKRMIGDPGGFFLRFRQQPESSPMFGEAICKRLVVTEISINAKAEEERKLEARLVLETDVQEGAWGKTLLHLGA